MWLVKLVRGRQRSARTALAVSLFGRLRQTGFQLLLARGKKTMPPKKKAEAAEGPGPLLGRFGTSLKCGIVGLPNVG